MIPALQAFFPSTVSPPATAASFKHTSPLPGLWFYIQHCPCRSAFVFKYLLGCAGSLLWHAESFFSCGLWDLVPCPGTDSGSPAWAARSLSNWTTREGSHMSESHQPPCLKPLRLILLLSIPSLTTSGVPSPQGVPLTMITLPVNFTSAPPPVAVGAG